LTFIRVDNPYYNTISTKYNLKMGDEVDEAIEVKPKFKDPLGGVMEGSKFAYFSKEEGKYDEFVGLLKSNPFHFYVVEYKYSSDNDGRPDFVAHEI